MQNHCAHIGLEIHTGQIKRKGADTLRRRRAHPRKFTQSRGVTRKLAIKSLHDIHRRLMQRKRTTVVSHTLPSSQNIGNGRLSQGPNSGKALEPRRPSIANAHHLRLLQHHLRKPDAVWIARAGSHGRSRYKRTPSDQAYERGLHSSVSAPNPRGKEASIAYARRRHFSAHETYSANDSRLKLGIHCRSKRALNHVGKRHRIKVIDHKSLSAHPNGMMARQEFMRGHSAPLAVQSFITMGP